VAFAGTLRLSLWLFRRLVVPEGTGIHHPAPLPASGSVRRLVLTRRLPHAAWRFRDCNFALPRSGFPSATREAPLSICLSRLL